MLLMLMLLMVGLGLMIECRCRRLLVVRCCWRCRLFDNARYLCLGFVGIHRSCTWRLATELDPRSTIHTPRGSRSLSLSRVASDAKSIDRLTRWKPSSPTATHSPQQTINTRGKYLRIYLLYTSAALPACLSWCGCLFVWLFVCVDSSSSSSEGRKGNDRLRNVPYSSAVAKKLSHHQRNRDHRELQRNSETHPPYSRMLVSLRAETRYSSTILL